MPATTLVAAAAALGTRRYGGGRRFGWLAFIVVPVLAAQLPCVPAGAQELRCGGRCAATILLGRQLDTGLAHVDGTASFVPPWQYDYGDSYFAGAVLSYSLVEFFRAIAIEIEGGVGQRFGSLHESESWIALYARWRLFPWNRYLRTSFALSTGLHYASGVTAYEASESPDGNSSRLLHYFSPEFTFALPSQPDVEFVIRYHHRSGGGDYFGNRFPVYGSLFRGAQGGMQYLTFGLRRHF